LTLSKTKMSEKDTITITVQVENTGNFDGKEVVQLYLRDLVGSISRPVLELKDFKKVEVKKGEKIKVVFEIDIQDLKFYNNDLQFVAEPGMFEVFVGTNSIDTLKSEFELINNP
jgi:beta-glucosidase